MALNRRSSPLVALAAAKLIQRPGSRKSVSTMPRLGQSTEFCSRDFARCLVDKGL
jgi:hypothetical protein